MNGTCTKCGAECARDQLHYTGLGFINGRVRAYCPKCWRKVLWAREHPNGRRAPRSTPQERANQRYWERVDNYRELGYDPNQYEGGR